MVLYDEQNIAHTFSLPKTRTLPAGDTLHVSFLVNVSDLPEGSYNLYLEVNPGNDQPEQYHYNNFFSQSISIRRGILLPVRLLDFTAKNIHNKAELTWTVSNELNVSNYSIEFSKDGRTFTEVGSVTATAMQTPVKTYSFLHRDVINGKNYYRIKTIDKDGSYSYSPVRAVIVNEENILIYPNPFRDHLNITSSKTLEGTVELLDLTGKPLLKQTFVENITLHLDHLASGIYILRLNNGVTVHSFKVYKGE
jgi:hypothetical protein